MRNSLSSPTAVTLTVIAAMGRLIPHPANFTPVGASTLFGGATLPRPWNYLAPLLVMFVTDIFLGFHATIIYVYGSFLLSAFLAERFLKNDRNLVRVGLLSVTTTLLFFLITNFGVWASTAMYAKTGAGLMESYLMGLPFLGNMLLGDLLFGVGFFGLYQLAEKSLIKEKFDKAVGRHLLLAGNNLEKY